MAEIPIQPKRNRSILPLILGLIVIAALIWFLMSRRNHDDTTPPAGTDTTKTSSVMSSPHRVAVLVVNSADRSTYVGQG